MVFASEVERMKEETIKAIASAIYNDLAPWERADGDEREILETLTSDPLEVVKFLVDRFIEEARA